MLEVVGRAETSMRLDFPWERDNGVDDKVHLSIAGFNDKHKECRSLQVMLSFK